MLGLHVGCSGTVAVHDSPADFALYVAARLIIVCLRYGQGIALLRYRRMPVKPVPKRDGQCKLYILTAIVFELAAERCRFCSLIGIVACAPASIKADAGHKLPFGGIQFTFCIKLFPGGNLDVRIVGHGKGKDRFFVRFLPTQNNAVTLCVSEGPEVSHNCKFFIHRPEHKVCKSHVLVLVHIYGIGKVVLTVSKIGLHLNDVGMAFLAQFLLPASLCKRLLCHRNLLFINVAKTLVIDHIIICLHHGQANIGFGLLLLGIGNLQSGFGNLEIVYSPKAVKKVIPSRNAVVVVERCCLKIGVSLRINTTTKIIICISLCSYLRSE